MQLKSMVIKSKQSQLDEVRQKIIDDNPIPALKAGATRLVFGDGNPDADLVFIGEAPGKNEDIQGKPFVGAAGKFLNAMLEMIGLKREDVYITNIVKYRPPGNRDPYPEEKKAMMPYLEAQLEIIQPVLTVTLGRHSLNCFLPDLSISQVHGQPKRFSILNTEARRLKNRGNNSESKLQDPNFMTLVILPLFHPAAALYNGSMKQTLIDDFARIPAVLKAITNS